MKKLFVILTLLFCGFMFFSAAQISTATDPYQALSPITDPMGKVQDNLSTNDFPGYLQAIYRIGIGACFVLGVIMFTWAGIEYIVSESMNTKADGKARMTAALTGLAIALVSYILLYTINPALLTFTAIKTTPSATAP